MRSKLHKVRKELSQSRPGRRFVDHYNRNTNQPTWKAWLIVTLGILMVVAGLVLSLPPGLPGFLLWVPGFALIASQIRIVAVILDRLECKIRDIYKKLTGRSLDQH